MSMHKTHFDGHCMVFAATEDPTEHTTDIYSNEHKFIFSYMIGLRLTMIFRNRDYMNRYKIKLIDLFLINFLFFWSELDERRYTYLCRYSYIVLSQM